MIHRLSCNITIIGNSTPLLVMPRRPTRDDGTYGEQLERMLNEAGVPSEVTNRAKLFELIHEGGPRFRHEEPGAFPDVLIIHYGMLELQPNVAPTTLVRHLTQVERGSRGLRGLWKRRGTTIVWPHVRRWQRWASERAGLRTWRLRPDRFGAELRHLIEVARATHALVLVLDVHRPNDRLEHFMPGLEPRWERINEVIRSVVDSFDDPDVRLIEAAKVVDDIGLASATADGLHLTPEAHRRTAEEIAAEILDSAVARVSRLRATVRDADVHLTRVLDRARRAWLLGRIRLLAFWRRTTLELDVATDLRLGRGVVVKVAPRSHLRIRIGPKCRIGEGVHLYLTGGSIDWEEDVQLRVRSALDLAGDLRCGSRVIFSYGCIIHCVDSITVGQLTAFAEYVTITDSAHYHSDPETHVTENTSWAPIVVGQNVFVAPCAQVNRGVTIGDYAIVGPNSVVVKDVPSGVFVSGVPAKVVRDPDLPWEREGG